MTGKSLVLCAIVLCLFFAALISRNGDLVWLTFPFIAYLGIGIGRSPASVENSVRLSRSAVKSRRDGAFLVEVAITARNAGTRTICVSISDPPQKGMYLTDGSLRLLTALRPGKEAELKYSFEAGRGVFGWRTAHVAVSDPSGVTETEIPNEAGASLFIQPPAGRLRPIPIRLRKTLSSPGPIPTRMGGSGTDFWMVREYHSGDPLKQLDWRMTARHPHRFFTREFVQEKTAEITLVLDGRLKLDLTVGKKNLFEIEVKAAASLAGMFLRQGHRVGLVVMGRTPVKVMPDYGKIQLNRILNCLAGVEAGTSGSFESLEETPIGHISRKSLMTVISPMDSFDMPFYRRLKAAGFEVLLICPDILDFANPILDRSTAGQLALRAGRLERALNLSRVSQISVSVIDWRVESPLWPLVRGALGRPLRVNKL
jgi:uncharacterized protein (DUF58 family)